MNIVDQRNSWRRKFEQGLLPEVSLLNEYIQNRDNPYWRLTRMVEELCEYTLYLEAKCDTQRFPKRISHVAGEV